MDLSLSLDRREEVNRFCMNETAWIIADSCFQVCCFVWKLRAAKRSLVWCVGVKLLTVVSLPAELQWLWIRVSTCSQRASSTP